MQASLSELDRTGLARAVNLLPKGHTRIETGFHYPDGSNIDLFIPRGEGLLQEVEPVMLTDFGCTLSWLAQLGINPLKSGRRRKLMKDVLSIYDVNERYAALGSGPINFRFPKCSKSDSRAWQEGSAMTDFGCPTNSLIASNLTFLDLTACHGLTIIAL